MRDVEPAVTVPPQEVEAMLAAAVDLHRDGRRVLATHAYRRVYAASPEHPAALNGLAALALEEGEPRRGEELARRAVLADPGLANGFCNLGLALHLQGRLHEARDALRHAMALAPGHAQALANLGNVTAAMGRMREAAALHERACALQPGNPAFLKNLAAAFTASGRATEAVGLLERARVIAPNDATIHNNLGNALAACGRAAEAASAYRRAIGLAGGYLEAASNLLFVMQHTEEGGEAGFAREVEAVGDLIAATVGGHEAVPAEPGGGRALRIGYVSPDLGHHPVGHLLAPVLEHRDRARFEVHCYSDKAVEDDQSERLRRAADVWHRTFATSDEALARLIRSDRVDILVDLAGHTAGNRLRVFAMRAAPVQVSWLGHVGSTGLRAMDFVVLDHMTAPPGCGFRPRERILRLPGCFLCYEPPADAPPVAPAMRGDGTRPTFGSFNRPMKTNPRVLRTWARVLAAVPGARLILKSPDYADPRLRGRILEAFTGAAVGPERVEFRGGSPHAAMLAEYGEVDVALDPFPFTGGITTCEALWMGVPVVTLAAEAPVSRMSLSFLTELDLEETVARDEEEYVAIAAALAADPQRRQRLRDGLRGRIRSSHLGDARAFTAAFEETLLEAWRQRTAAPLSSAAAGRGRRHQATQPPPVPATEGQGCGRAGPGPET